MDESLPLDLPEPLLSGPFTRSRAASVGVGRAAVERMLRQGVVRRLLRGVYAGADQPETSELRARALALVLSPRSVVVDRTAAWVHGLAIPGRPAAGIDALGRSRPDGHFGGRRRLTGPDVVDLAGVRLTTPLRTAGDLGRLLAPERALAVLDEVLRHGVCSHAELLAELPRHARLKRAGQLRRLVGLADARAATATESVLRLRWLDAGLPTPVPQLPVGGATLTLGLAEQRFGAVLGPWLPEHHALAAAGWCLVPVTSVRVLASDAELVATHLCRHYHRHLLRLHSEHGSADGGRDLVDDVPGVRHRAAARHGGHGSHQP